MLGSLRVGFDRREQVASCMGPTANLDDAAVYIEVVVDYMGVGDQVAPVARQQGIHGSTVVLKLKRYRTCLPGATGRPASVSLLRPPQAATAEVPVLLGHEES